MSEVTAEFVLSHLVRKEGHWEGGKWNGRSIFGTSTDLKTGRPTMLVERREIGPDNILIPPFTETIFIDQTTVDQFQNPS